MRNLRTVSLVAAFGLGCVACVAQEDDAPTVKGYVTKGATLQSFEVNGLRVIPTAKTVVSVRSGEETLTGLGIASEPFLGERVDLYGKEDRKNHTISATRITLQAVDSLEVDGAGMIDAVGQPRAQDPAGSRMVRADGYMILVEPRVAVGFEAPATAAPPLTTNVWVTFHGKQRADGVLVADRIKARPNGVSKREDKMLTKSDYDPQAVNKDAKQSGVSKFFKGIDPKQIPPYEDAAMQARVQAIGEKLVPQYQKALSDDDETKLSFEFQVVDMTKWKHDAHTLPNGIILVPKQVVERLQNDSQIAAVLADNIACALEKQDYRAFPGQVGLGATNIAGAVAGAFVPGLGLLTGVGTTAAAAKAVRLSQEQSGRVSLGLMKDAGYDLSQAPLAWWLLASNKPKEVTSISMPHRVGYLYETLARNWHTPAATAVP